jgi:hypothetical protein
MKPPTPTLSILLLAGCAYGPEHLPQLRSERDRLQSTIWEIERQHGFSLSESGLEQKEKELLAAAQELEKGRDEVAQGLTSMEERERKLQEGQEGLQAAELEVEKAKRFWFSSLTAQERLQWLMHEDEMEIHRAQLKLAVEEKERDRLFATQLLEAQRREADRAQALQNIKQGLGQIRAVTGAQIRAGTYPPKQEP